MEKRKSTDVWWKQAFLQITLLLLSLCAGLGVWNGRTALAASWPGMSATPCTADHAQNCRRDPKPIVNRKHVAPQSLLVHPIVPQCEKLRGRRWNCR